MAKKKENSVYVGPRQCSSYNPLEHLVDIQSTTGEIGKYLLVPERVTWFNIYCHEKGIEGIIDDSQVEFYPEKNLVKAICIVYMNGKEIARSVGSGVFREGDDVIFRKAIECAATSAKGRALANAGFGSNLAAGDEPEQGPVDAPVDVSAVPKKTSPTKPEAPRKTEVKIPTTLAEALALKIDIKGEHTGRTMGEVNAIDPQYIQFLATKYNGTRHPEYPAAAKIIINN